MAQLMNGRTGAALLAVQIEPFRKEMEQGGLWRQSVLMNSDMGLLWTRVTYLVGEQTIFTQDVLLHSISIASWESNIAAMDPTVHERIPFAIESPELYIEVTHYGRPSDDPADDPIYQNPTCQFLVYVDTTIAAGSFGISMSGPAMVLTLPMSEIQKFARKLNEESKVVLKSAPPLIDGTAQLIEE